MKLRELKRRAQEKHGWPYTIRYRGYDQGYDPVTGETWKPNRSTRNRLHITIRSWTGKEWRGVKP